MAAIDNVRMEKEESHGTEQNRTELLILLTRRPTNWWGSAKRDVTYPTASSDCHIQCLVSLVPKTFVHDRASTRIGELTATTIRHQPFMQCVEVYNEKTATSQLRNAKTTVCPLELPFLGPGSKNVCRRTPNRGIVKWRP